MKCKCIKLIASMTHPLIQPTVCILAKSEHYFSENNYVFVLNYNCSIYRIVARVFWWNIHNTVKPF